MPEFVIMRHPKIEGSSGPTTRKAFEEIHRHKGWELDEESTPTAPTPTPEPEANDAEAPSAPAAGGRKHS